MGASWVLDREGVDPINPVGPQFGVQMGVWLEWQGWECLLDQHQKHEHQVEQINLRLKIKINVFFIRIEIVPSLIIYIDLGKKKFLS